MGQSGAPLPPVQRSYPRACQWAGVESRQHSGQCAGPHATTAFPDKCHGSTHASSLISGTVKGSRSGRDRRARHRSAAAHPARRRPAGGSLPASTPPTRFDDRRGRSGVPLRRRAAEPGGDLVVLGHQVDNGHGHSGKACRNGVIHRRAAAAIDGDVHLIEDVEVTGVHHLSHHPTDDSLTAFRRGFPLVEPSSDRAPRGVRDHWHANEATWAAIERFQPSLTASAGSAR